MNDSHAVGDDETDHYAAFIAQNPHLGQVFVTDDGRPVLIGKHYGTQELAVIDDAGVSHSLEGAVQVFGPLRRARVVSADAIVLERPDDDDQNIFTATGMVRYEEQRPGEYFLLPTEARDRAAWLALAADEAERGQQ